MDVWRYLLAFDVFNQYDWLRGKGYAHSFHSNIIFGFIDKKYFQLGAVFIIDANYEIKAWLLSWGYPW